MGDLAAVLGSMERLLRWERIASRLQHEEGISTVCEYDRRTLAEGDAALIAVEHAGTAPDAVPESQASFLATSTPWGWRMAGELDLANGAGLIRAVRARVRPGADLWLDVGSVSFIDIGTLTALYQTAAGLPDGSRIRLSQASAHLRHLIEISGLADPHLVVEP
jgi:anti-anti-sigma regulatory factor